MLNTNVLRNTGILIFVHLLMLVTGFYTLVAIFEFPNVLRMDPAYRLNLFLENSNIIIPTYYTLAMTGLTQVAIAVLLHQLLAATLAPTQSRSLLALSTVFGILTGLFQVLGYIRWPILIAFLAQALRDGSFGVSQETIIFVEAVANRYFGMTVGEHLGFLAQSVWATTLGIVMLGGTLFSRALGWATVITGIATFFMGLEPLGGLLEPLGLLSQPVNVAWVLVQLFIGVSLLRTNQRTGEGIRFGWRSFVGAAVAWALLTVPAFLP